MVEVITNGHWRNTQYGHPDWVDETDENAIEEYITYRGEVYWLSEFMRTSFPNAPEWIREWDGYMGDSFFSGIVVRYGNWESDRDGQLQVGTYIS